MSLTGRELIKKILESDLLDSQVIIWHQTQGRQRIIGIDVDGDPDFGEIELITDGKSK